MLTTLKFLTVVLLCCLRAYTAEVVVYWDDERQPITGFGGSGAYTAGNFQKLDSVSKRAVCDLLFDSTTGIGLSMVRNEIKTWLIAPQPGTWDFTKDNDQIWLMNEAKKRGATYFWSAPWSPPAYMKSNNETRHGGNLLPGHYQNYADLLSRYVREYKNRFDLEIKAISVQNEPGANVDYESCLWNGIQIRDFIKNNLGPTFIRDGVKAKIMMSESGGWDGLSADVDPCMFDSACRSYAGIIAGHQYDQTAEIPAFLKPFKTTLEPPYAPAKQYGIEVWQTEASYIGSKADSTMRFGLGTAMLVHNMMAGAEVSVWTNWVLLNSWGDNQGLVDRVGTTYRATKRLYCLGNFSKFVRPGYRMVGMTTNPDTGIFCTAYKKPSTGDFAIVIINVNSSGKRSLSFSGVTASSIIPYVTSSVQNLAPQTSIAGTDSGFTITIGPVSVTTLVGKSGRSNRACKPIISAPHCYLNAPVSATITSYTSGASIYYTADGTVPTLQSTRYTAPVPVDKPTTITAIAVLPGLLASEKVSVEFRDMLKAGAPAKLVPGIHYRYYEGGWMYLPGQTAQLSSPIHAGIQDSLSIGKWHGNDRFLVDFSGYLDVPVNGLYTFFLMSDDGSTLWIDSIPVVNNDGVHNAREVSGEAGLLAGKHSFRLYYFDRIGSDTLLVDWQGPGFKRTPVSPWQLFSGPVGK